MTDRELLELAAKAAGLDLDCSIRPDGLPFYHSGWNGMALVDGGWFCPLTDDGDEARLEAALGLSVKWLSQHVIVGNTMLDTWQESYAMHGGDKQAARRYAGVRAAAEIGRAK